MVGCRCLILAAVVVTGCDPRLPPPAGPKAKPTPAPPVAPKKEAPKEKEPAGSRVALTGRAAKQVRKLLTGAASASRLRVSVSGDQIKLDLDPDTDPKGDLLSESRGVPVAVDRESAALLPAGIVVDYIDEGGTAGFKFASPGSDRDQPDSVALADARRGFGTALLPPAAKQDKTPLPEAPGELFKVVRYDAAPGKLAAYLTPDPGDGKKRPAVVWITGGDCNTIDAGCWRDGGAADQSASAFRKAGVVTMFPSLRGGNDNPGRRESFLGEVDDVLAAAAAFLRKQPHVDAGRVYLGGHSTGGTLALLAAECSDSFRAVFSFGPVADVLQYGLGAGTFSLADAKELRLRSPGQWLHSIRSPVFVFEGASGGNASSLRSMAGRTRNPKVHFFVVGGADHFNLLGPTNRLIAGKVLGDTGPECNLAFTEQEVGRPFVK